MCVDLTVGLWLEEEFQAASLLSNSLSIIISASIGPCF